MATYTNLKSLKGLQIGDVVNYTITTAFDTKGYKFRVELYGKQVYANGGLTKFAIDTSVLPQTILSFNSRGDLIYGDTTDLYYRIAVAGDSGSKGAAILGSGGYGGAGGGSVGGDGNQGKGGGQTYGGSGYSSGSFGKGGYDSAGGGSGGYGWYGGGSGRFTTGSATGGGGGSGFIIGVSTKTYPYGYLGNNAALITSLTQSISEGSLTQGGSTSYTAKMVITVIALPEVTSTQSTIKYYNGSSFVDTNIKYYNGTEFVDCDAFYYNGNEFVKI